MTQTLPAYLADALDRKVSREELAVALGISVATLNRRKQDGFSADDIIRAVRYFGLSPVKALVQCGLISQEDVNASAGVASIEGFSDLDIAQEMVRRVAAGTASDMASAPLDRNHPAVVREFRDVSHRGVTLAAYDDEMLTDELEALEQD